METSVRLDVEKYSSSIAGLRSSVIVRAGRLRMQDRKCRTKIIGGKCKTEKWRTKRLEEVCFI